MDCTPLSPHSRRTVEAFMCIGNVPRVADARNEETCEKRAGGTKICIGNVQTTNTYDARMNFMLYNFRKKFGIV